MTKTATQINTEPYWSDGFSSVGLDGGGGISGRMPPTISVYTIQYRRATITNTLTLCLIIVKLAPRASICFTHQIQAIQMYHGSYICKFITRMCRVKLLILTYHLV